MIKLKSNKGITLMVLMITIIVVLIIAGITINLSIDSIDQTIESQDKSEMLIVQHVMQERWQQYLENGESDESMLIGSILDQGMLNIIQGDSITDEEINSRMNIKTGGLGQIGELESNKKSIKDRVISSQHEIQLFYEEGTDYNWSKVEFSNNNNIITFWKTNQLGGSNTNFRKYMSIPTENNIIKIEKKNEGIIDIDEFRNNIKDELTHYSYDNVTDKWRQNDFESGGIRDVDDNEEVEKETKIGLIISKEPKYTITFSDFDLLGITGDGVTNSEFKVNYETGYVEKIGSKVPALQSYRRDSAGNTTSKMIEITN